MNALDKGGRETTTKERERQRQRRETSKVRGVVHTESTSLAAFYGCPQGQALHISVDEPLRSSRVGARLHSPEVSPVQSRHPARAPDGWVGARSKQPPEGLLVPTDGGGMQGREPKGVPPARRRGAPLEQQVDRSEVSAEGGHVQCAVCRARVVETLAQAAPQKWQGCARDCVGNAEDGSQ